MAKVEVIVSVPDVVYEKLEKLYEAEGYDSVEDFIVDILRDKMKAWEKQGGAGKRKRDFLDYFSEEKKGDEDNEEKRGEGNE